MLVGASGSIFTNEMMYVWPTEEAEGLVIWFVILLVFGFSIGARQWTLCQAMEEAEAWCGFICSWCLDVVVGPGNGFEIGSTRS